MAEQALRFTARDVSKSFGAVRALRHGQLSVRPGEVHALVGENGAGKSTLIKILSGAILPDHGELQLDEHVYSPRSPEHALRAGIGTVYQDPQIVPSMMVAENILLGRFPTGAMGVMRKSTLREMARSLLASLQIHLDPAATCEKLSVADQQLLQVARAASFKTLKLLILDEPTSSLTPGEVKRLFALVERLRQQGVSILFVSHKLEEVMEYSDAVTVFRDGRFVASHRKGEFTLASLVREMVGREIEPAPPKAERVSARTPSISVSGLSGKRFRDVSFEVYPGEIFGLFGLVGAGRTEVLRSIFGVDPIISGGISIKGKAYRPRHVRDAIGRGLALVPEDRKGQGLVISLSVKENLTLPAYRRYATWGVMRRAAQLGITRQLAKALGIKAAGPEAPVSSLSGGNQQKVVLARWISLKPALLMLDEPAAGIDIGAKSDVYKLIEALAAEGTPILVVSSELPEILRLCHRVGVMRDGRLVGIVDHADANEEVLLTMATVGAVGARGSSSVGELA